jgi:ribosomal protein L6P/L9E
MIVKENLTKSERNLLISKIKSIEKGITTGHRYSLNLQGVGFSIKMDESNKKLILNIGYTNKIIKNIPKDINIEIKGSEGNVTMIGVSRNLDNLSQ